MKIEMGSNELNEAAWMLLDEIVKIDGEISPELFNNLKPVLKEAIELFLTMKLESKWNESC